jgi:hypothetical protein
MSFVKYRLVLGKYQIDHYRVVRKCRHLIRVRSRIDQLNCDRVAYNDPSKAVVKHSINRGFSITIVTSFI